jgi:hypothetical protein
MKKILLIILFMICTASVWTNAGYTAFVPNNDPELLIGDLEKSIAEQEKLLNNLRARYARIIARKKELSDWIEQEKQKLAQLQAGKVQPKVEKQQKMNKALPEKKEDLYKLDRELQISLSMEKKKNSRNNKDINYLSSLIKKQKELCAEISQLENDIAAEERILKQLKESRKLPANF